MQASILNSPNDPEALAIFVKVVPQQPAPSQNLFGSDPTPQQSKPQLNLPTVNLFGPPKSGQPPSSNLFAQQFEQRQQQSYPSLLDNQFTATEPTIQIHQAPLLIFTPPEAQRNQPSTPPQNTQLPMDSSLQTPRKNGIQRTYSFDGNAENEVKTPSEPQEQEDPEVQGEQVSIAQQSEEKHAEEEEAGQEVDKEASFEMSSMNDHQELITTTEKKDTKVLINQIIEPVNRFEPILLTRFESFGSVSKTDQFVDDVAALSIETYMESKEILGRVNWATRLDQRELESLHKTMASNVRTLIEFKVTRDYQRFQGIKGDKKFSELYERVSNGILKLAETTTELETTWRSHKLRPYIDEKRLEGLMPANLQYMRQSQQIYTSYVIDRSVTERKEHQAPAIAIQDLRNRLTSYHQYYLKQISEMKCNLRRLSYSTISYDESQKVVETDKDVLLAKLMFERRYEKPEVRYVSLGGTPIAPPRQAICKRPKLQPVRNEQWLEWKANEQLSALVSDTRAQTQQARKEQRSRVQEGEVRVNKLIASRVLDTHKQIVIQPTPQIQVPPVLPQSMNRFQGYQMALFLLFQYTQFLRSQQPQPPIQPQLMQQANSIFQTNQPYSGQLQTGQPGQPQTGQQRILTPVLLSTKTPSGQGNLFVNQPTPSTSGEQSTRHKYQTRNSIR